MKIWYQSMARQEPGHSTEHYLKGVSRQLHKLAGPSAEVHVEGISRSGGEAVFWRFYELLDTRDVMANALRAEREGFDAFLIGNIADPGLYEAREMVDIPVLGLCEAACHTAMMMGRSFAMISIYEKFNTRIRDQIERYGLLSRFSGIYQMPKGSSSLPSTMGNWYEDGIRCREVVEAFVVQGRKAVEEGAEVLVAAGGLIMALLAREGIREVDGAPVLDGTAALIKLGRFAVEMKEAHGTFTSRALTFSKPPAQFQEEIAQAYGGGAEEAIFADRRQSEASVGNTWER